MTNTQKYYINQAINELTYNAQLKEWDNYTDTTISALDYDHEPTNHAQALRNAYNTNTLNKAQRREIAKGLRAIKNDYNIIERITINKLIKKLEW